MPNGLRDGFFTHVIVSDYLPIPDPDEYELLAARMAEARRVGCASSRRLLEGRAFWLGQQDKRRRKRHLVYFLADMGTFPMTLGSDRVDASPAQLSEMLLTTVEGKAELDRLKSQNQVEPVDLRDFLRATRVDF